MVDRSADVRDPAVDGGASTSATATAGTRWVLPSWYAFAVVGVFALYPFVAYLNRNRAELSDPGALFVLAVIVYALSMAVVAVLSFVLPRTPGDRVAVGVAAFLASFFAFNTFFSSNPSDGQRLPQLAIWSLLTVLLIATSARFARLAGVRTFVLVFGAALLLPPAVGYIAWRVSEGEPESATDIEVPPLFRGEVVTKPNVYLFVFDEYGRIDNLSDVLGYDNAPFYEELRDRDFVVAEAAHSPFQQTVPALASIFETDYLVDGEGEELLSWEDMQTRLRGDNSVVESFKEQGYQFIYSDPGRYDWNRCTPELADLCIDPQGKGLGLTELQISVLDLTPVGSLDLTRESITDPVHVLNELDANAEHVDEPFFLFSHVISPHWPFRYTEQCGLRSRFGYTEVLLDKSAIDRASYVQDVGCLNELILEGVDRIIEADPTAIVILMSDHGSKFIPDGAKPLSDWRPEAIREELGILFAVRLPKRCEGEVAHDHNSINTFPIVAGCMEGREPDLLDNRAFIWDHFGAGPQEVEDLSVLDPTS